MARPTKLTPEVQKTITDAIAIGATYQAAAEYAGIAYETFNEWMKDKRPKFVKFSEAVREANAKARVTLLARIQTSAKDGDWRAAAWILERRFSEDFKPSAKVDVTWKEVLEKNGFEAGTAFEQLVQAAYARATATDGGGRADRDTAATKGESNAD